MDDLANNVNEYGVLILTDRDRIEFDYIMKTRGEEWVKYAMENLQGARKPYVSNISKLAKLQIPLNLEDPEKILPPEQALRYIQEIRSMLKK